MSVALCNHLKTREQFAAVEMDIEGAEIPVVSASRDYLRWDKDIRFACCTYHNAGDAEALECLFREAGYFTEFSDGWMLPTARHLSPPYFRRGVIRAWRRELSKKTENCFELR